MSRSRNVLSGLTGLTGIMHNTGSGSRLKRGRTTANSSDPDTLAPLTVELAPTARRLESRPLIYPKSIAE
jgi:hypothetical protein